MLSFVRRVMRTPSGCMGYGADPRNVFLFVCMVTLSFDCTNTVLSTICMSIPLQEVVSPWDRYRSIVLYCVGLCCIVLCCFATCCILST